MVGNDNQAEFVGRVILKKKFVDGVDDDAVFMVGRKENEKPSFTIVQYGSVGRSKIIFFVENNGFVSCFSEKNGYTKLG